MNLHFVSLGCARNLVDSEIMMGRIEREGWSLTDDPDQAHVIVVNTCSFIQKATDESIDTILELSVFKESGRCRRLIVVGCLPERYGEDITEALPEVDLFLGTGAFDELIAGIRGDLAAGGCLLVDPNLRPMDRPDERGKSTWTHTAYLKVAEGCDRKCTYCIIPRLRGKHRSRGLPDLVLEAKNLIFSGARELNLVAQDTTSWGYDHTPPEHPATLLKALSNLSSDTWIRLLYGHPDRFDERLIRAMGETPGVCPYFDIPVQHVSEKILRRMGRHGNKDTLLKLFETIREIVPQAVIRTTLIVGFPGETRKDVDDLLNFMDRVRFDHLGVFTYSDAEDLPSHRLDRHVLQKTADRRHDRIMAAQLPISRQINEKYLDQELDVLIEETPEEGVYIGRTWFQAPEVDGITYVKTGGIDADRGDKGVGSGHKEFEIGSLVRVKISDTLEYDLVGEPI